MSNKEELERVLLVNPSKECIQIPKELEDVCVVDVIDSTDEQQDWTKVKYSAVVINLIERKLEGYAFIETLHERKEFKLVPMIAIDYRGYRENLIRAVQIGVRDYIEIPFSQEEIKETITNAFRIHKSMELMANFTYDPLTGLLTKQGFQYRAEELIKKNEGKRLDLVYVNIENFRSINERYGEDIGNAVLICLAKCIKELLGCLLSCRLVSDRFVFLQNYTQELDVKEQLKELNTIVSEALNISGFEVKFGIYRDIHGNDPLNQCIDGAGEAADSIRNQYRKMIAYYDEQKKTKAGREQVIIDCMEKALEEEQFVVYYQPKHDIHTGNIVGAEALIRWIHPEFGFMSPMEFIPLFEKNGFISQVDAYIWERTCINLKRWQEQGLTVVPISVNASRHDFFEVGHIDMLIKTVQRIGISPSLLHLEVTETVYTEFADELVDLVRKMQKQGFKIEMDDFGSGYSSLNMLSELPMDILKLDMKFVGNIDQPRKRVVVKSCIDLAKHLELKTVAEGVETEQQKDKLKEIGCDYVQGYYYAKPMPENEFENYLISMEKKGNIGL